MILGSILQLMARSVFNRYTTCLSHGSDSSALDQYICLGGSGSRSCGYITMYPLRIPVMFPSNSWLAQWRTKYSKLINSSTKRFYADGSHLQRSEYKGGLVVKSGHFVDWDFPLASKYHLLKDENGVPYATTIVNSDIFRNLNTVVQIQIYEHDILPWYAFFYSWKRLGTKIGKIDYRISASKSRTIDKFQKVSRHFRNNFSKCQENTESHSAIDVIRFPGIQEYIGNAHELHPSVRKLLHMFRNPWSSSAGEYSNQTRTLEVVEYDETLQPAGILSEAQLQRGRSILKRLRGILDTLKRGSESREDDIMKESNNFYSAIPHATGLKRLPRLDNFKLLAEKYSLIDRLSNMNRRMSQGTPRDGCALSDPDFLRYRLLNSDIQYVRPSSETYSIVQRYLHYTSPDSQLGIVDLFRICRRDEEKTFKSELGNRHLLWHGTSRANFTGILTTGMQINPPGVRKLADNFGSGLYFSDVADKSFQFCCKTGDSLLLLADVALGRVQKAIYREERAKDCDSVMGCCLSPSNSAWNKYGPPAEKKDGCVVPLGAEGATEYVVFDPKQVCLRYIVRVRHRSASFLEWTLPPTVPNTVDGTSSSRRLSTSISAKSQTQQPSMKS